MNITDELREYADRFINNHDAWIGLGDDLADIADRIDIEHKKAVDIAFTNGRTDGIADGCAYYDTEHTECMLSEEHGWVRGPLDADGVMWHEGDMSDSVWGEIWLIMRDVDGHWYIKGHDTSSPWVRADSMRHQHEQTVEDVLDEFASAYDRIGGEDEEHQKYLDLIAEYAAKLQLKAQ